MATLIHVNGQKEVVRPKNGTKFTLEELQLYVGGYIEKIPLSNFGSPAFCNEDGIRLRLPYNDLASRMWHTRLLGEVIMCDPGEVD